MSTVIIGAGAIGQAISHELLKAGRLFEVWDVDTSKHPSQRPLEEILPQADVVFFCVPSGAVRSVGERVSPLLRKGAVVIALAKGIEAASRKTVDALLAESLPKKQPFALLAGPMLAAEMVADLGSCAVVATKDEADAQKVMRLFRGSGLSLRFSRDVRGTAYASVLKNVYAIALGIADGLAWGENKKGWLAAQAIGEMAGILKVFGAASDTVFGPAGCGDFIATGFSEHSRNRQVGDELVRTGMCCLPSEGVSSIGSVAKSLGPDAKKYPLFSALSAVLIRHAAPVKTFDKLYADAFKARAIPSRS